MTSPVRRFLLCSAVLACVSGGADAETGSGDSSASEVRGGRIGRSSVPPKISSVAFSGAGQIIGQ